MLFCFVLFLFMFILRPREVPMVLPAKWERGDSEPIFWKSESNFGKMGKIGRPNFVFTLFSHVKG